MGGGSWGAFAPRGAGSGRLVGGAGSRWGHLGGTFPQGQALVRGGGGRLEQGLGGWLC